jgi:hypothetical protein
MNMTRICMSIRTIEQQCTADFLLPCINSCFEANAELKALKCTFEYVKVSFSRAFSVIGEVQVQQLWQYVHLTRNKVFMG